MLVLFKNFIKTKIQTAMLQYATFYIHGFCSAPNCPDTWCKILLQQWRCFGFSYNFPIDILDATTASDRLLCKEVEVVVQGEGRSAEVQEQPSYMDLLRVKTVKRVEVQHPFADSHRKLQEKNG